MAYSQLIDFSNNVADEVCSDPQRVETINAVVPELVGLSTGFATGNPIAQSSAKAATQVAIKKQPEEVAKAATAIATGVATDLMVPVALVAAAGVGVAWCLKKAIKAIVD